MLSLSKRDQLLETALRLFSKHGFHAVGIDTIVKESGVTKKTLYNHFSSKDALICEVLQKHEKAFREHLVEKIASASPSAKGRLLSIFDIAHAWFEQEDFYGCIFVSASCEFPEMNTAIRDVCADSKRLIREHVISLGTKAGVQEPEELAAHIVLLLEGAISIAQISGSSRSAKQAKKAARVLIEAALKSPR